MGRRYHDDIDLEQTTYDTHVSMNGWKVDGRVDGRRLTVNGNGNFRRMRVRGQFYGWNTDIDGTADFSDSAMEEWYFHSSSVGGNLIAKNTHVNGDATLKRVDAEHMILKGMTVDGTLSLEANETEYIDLRGASIEELRVDDLDRYRIRVDDDTYIGAVREGYGMPDDIGLTETEQEWYDRVLDRPRLPFNRYDGCVFTHDSLGKDFVMDAERNGLLGSLKQKGVIQDLDEEYRIIRSDV